MTAEPDWEKWRLTDAAHLWQWVALLVGLNPDAMDYDFQYGGIVWRAAGETKDFRRFLQIALSSVDASNLACVTETPYPWTNKVLKPEFLRWAQSKGIPIPPELKPPDPTGSASTGAAASSRIEGVKAFRGFCEARGLMLTSDRAAYAFMLKAEIKPIDGHAKKGRRVWDAAAVEPKVIAESERRKKVGE